MAFTWQHVAKATSGLVAKDLANGPASAQSRLRLFGKAESEVRVTLYRDHHAWCPYCQKVWLWLEESRVPYRVKKVTMFCYGQKERWYKNIVPSGMLPAIELDGSLVTESDVILEALEVTFGPLGGKSLVDGDVVRLRRLERQLFGAWCEWLCRPQSSKGADARNRERFEAVADAVDSALAKTPGPFFLGEALTTADVVFVPYVERMNASLFYYKGFELRDRAKRPRLCAWFEALETRDATYLGTQSDFHTHCHDLPPQMGGCYGDQKQHAALVDARGPEGLGALETTAPAPADAALVAADRVLKFKDQIASVNPEHAEASAVDAALLATVANLLSEKGADPVAPPPGTAAALRYVRDRVNVPRDMPIHSARALCAALEATAGLDSTRCPRNAIKLDHRRDQDPRPFLQAS